MHAAVTAPRPRTFGHPVKCPRPGCPAWVRHDEALCEDCEEDGDRRHLAGAWLHAKNGVCPGPATRWGSVPEIGAPCRYAGVFGCQARYGDPDTVLLDAATPDVRTLSYLCTIRALCAARAARAWAREVAAAGPRASASGAVYLAALRPYPNHAPAYAGSATALRYFEDFKYLSWEISIGPAFPPLPHVVGSHPRAALAECISLPA